MRAKRIYVDVSNIVYGGDRLGIYFIEKSSQRGSKVVYDRKYSSISMAKEKILTGIGFLTGLNGFILQALHRLFLIVWQKFVLMHVNVQKKKV